MRWMPFCSQPVPQCRSFGWKRPRARCHGLEAEFPSGLENGTLSAWGIGGGTKQRPAACCQGSGRHSSQQRLTGQLPNAALPVSRCDIREAAQPSVTVRRLHRRRHRRGHWAPSTSESLCRLPCCPVHGSPPRPERRRSWHRFSPAVLALPPVVPAGWWEPAPGRFVVDGTPSVGEVRRRC